MSTSDPTYPRRVLRIRNDGLHGAKTRVYMGEVDISHWLHGVEVHLRVDAANRAILKVYVDEVEIDVESMVNLIGISRKRIRRERRRRWWPF